MYGSRYEICLNEVFYSLTILSLSTNLRSSHQRCSVEKVLLENSQNSQESISARASFLINFVKKEPLNRWFPVNFAKFQRTPLLPPDECFCNKKKKNAITVESKCNHESIDYMSKPWYQTENLMRKGNSLTVTKGISSILK